MADYATLQQRHRDEFAEHLPHELDALTWPAERRRLERERRLRELLHVARSRSQWHAARIAAGLAATGVADPDVSLVVVDAFERQASGKLKRFVPL